MKRPTTRHYHAHRVFRADRRYIVFAAIFREKVGKSVSRRKIIRYWRRRNWAELKERGNTPWRSW